MRALRLCLALLLALAFVAGQPHHGVALAGEARGVVAAHHDGHHGDPGLHSEAALHHDGDDAAPQPGKAAQPVGAACAPACCAPLAFANPALPPAPRPLRHVLLPQAVPASLGLKPALPPPRG